MNDLEDLLNAGDPVLYGQVCWSIANCGTERLTEGDVITLEGVDEAGNRTIDTFRLTRETVANVERCLGLRTCREAAELCVERTQGEPRGECLHGHPDAALKYMMHGIEPTEPCPNCGEIPRFSDAAMSLNFSSDEPVKAADGNEYRECPQCGEDALELRGKSPVGWGWHIACLSCDWEIKQAERLDIDQYCDLMEEVKLKVESISQLMEMPGITIRTRVESASLQLRMLLELIVFSSLVSNKDIWQKSQKELQSSQDMSKKTRPTTYRTLRPHSHTDWIPTYKSAVQSAFVSAVDPHTVAAIEDYGNAFGATEYAAELVYEADTGNERAIREEAISAAEDALDAALGRAVSGSVAYDAFRDSLRESCRRE